MIHRRHRERVLCFGCPGVAKNGMFCVHETVALRGTADCRDSESNCLDRSLSNTRNSAIHQRDSAMEIENSGDCSVRS